MRTPSEAFKLEDDFIRDNKYVVTGLTAGETYTFVVNTVNGYGISVDSTQFTVLSAYKPYQPLSPATQNEGNDVKLSWLKPQNGGTPITDYVIQVQNFRGEYVEFIGACADKLTLMTCSIPAQDFGNAPFSLQQLD